MTAATGGLHFGPPRIGEGGEGTGDLLSIRFFVGTTGEKQGRHQTNPKPFSKVNHTKKKCGHTKSIRCCEGKDCIIRENADKLREGRRIGTRTIAKESVKRIQSSGKEIR